jgi:hypothetical protein
LAAASVFNRKRELAGQSLQTGFGSCDKVASKFDLAGVVAIAGSETSSDYAGRNDHSAFLVTEYFVLKLRALFVALQRDRHSRSVSIEVSPEMKSPPAPSMSACGEQRTTFARTEFFTKGTHLRRCGLAIVMSN